MKNNTKTISEENAKNYCSESDSIWNQDAKYITQYCESLIVSAQKSKKHYKQERQNATLSGTYKSSVS